MRAPSTSLFEVWFMRLYHRTTAENGELIGADPRARCKRTPPALCLHERAEWQDVAFIQLFSVTCAT
jgi:hypothetical protein